MLRYGRKLHEYAGNNCMAAAPAAAAAASVKCGGFDCKRCPPRLPPTINCLYTHKTRLYKSAHLKLSSSKGCFHALHRVCKTGLSRVFTSLAPPCRAACDNFHSYVFSNVCTQSRSGCSREQERGEGGEGGSVSPSFDKRLNVAEIAG